MNSILRFSQRIILATIRSIIKFNGFNQKSSRRKKFVKRQMRRKPRNGEGDQIERITPRERVGALGAGRSRGEARRAREVLGEEEGEEGGSVCTSRERGTVRWWDLFIVIPVLQLSSSLARPLINHSSTTHRLAKSPFLSRSRPPYRSRNLAVPLEGYLETADGPRSEERSRGGSERVYLCFRIRAILPE